MPEATKHVLATQTIAACFHMLVSTLVETVSGSTGCSASWRNLRTSSYTRQTHAEGIWTSLNFAAHGLTVDTLEMSHQPITNTSFSIRDRIYGYCEHKFDAIASLVLSALPTTSTRHPLRTSHSVRNTIHAMQVLKLVSRRPGSSTALQLTRQSILYSGSS